MTAKKVRRKQKCLSPGRKNCTCGISCVYRPSASRYLTFPSMRLLPFRSPLLFSSSSRFLLGYLFLSASTSVSTSPYLFLYVAFLSVYLLLFLFSSISTPHFCLPFCCLLICFSFVSPTLSLSLAYHSSPFLLSLLVWCLHLSPSIVDGARWELRFWLALLFLSA